MQSSKLYALPVTRLRPLTSPPGLKCPSGLLVCVQDEKLALANAVKQALNTARDAAEDGTLPAPQASKAPRAPRSTADRVGPA